MPLRPWVVDQARLRDGARLAALKATGLLDGPGVPALDAVAAEASRRLQAPTAMVSLVDADRQVFPGAVGLPEPVASARQTPLTHSICQYAVMHEAPIVIGDLRTHPELSSNPAVSELGVGAYAGAPLVTSDGLVLGTLCVLDNEPREWTDAQVETLTEMADQVVGRLERR